jgi:hypothetical protein
MIAVVTIRRRLASDVDYARARVTRLRWQLARAERALELRERELERFVSRGIVPSRKRVLDEARYAWRAAGTRRKEGR